MNRETAQEQVLALTAEFAKEMGIDISDIHFPGLLTVVNNGFNPVDIPHSEEQETVVSYYISVCKHFYGDIT